MGKGKSKGERKGKKKPEKAPESGNGAVPVPSVSTKDPEPTPVVAVPVEPPPAREPIRVPDRPTTTAERRLFRRVPFFRKVEYKFATIDHFKKEIANDLSLGGMFIKTEAPEPVGSILYLQFDLADGSPILRGYGKVVRVNPPGVPDFDAGMGIEFLKFDDESLARIRALVSERFGG